ncbi:hypothetical protein HOL21_02505 [Candidatus Woesearchaeota archaeon]|nr:hypothetical protein [Candidatus Woesearchaeota archaeon]MBT5397063.1 hypothetical protein [Candidatus Woesearchaeota archaeon]MBT5924814.1 hypothetical protein [Candidatus Woesearchaeota archaeon]MBT6367391.1 hypothetical protein [Candidatus Woesearchaeota archaeon]MBT7762463.1 hypothetical protein [Candidatus Woesearchaeota archaeon]
MSLPRQIQSRIASIVERQHKEEPFPQLVPLEDAVDSAIHCLGPEFIINYLNGNDLDSSDYVSIAIKLERDGVIRNTVEYTQTGPERTYQWN